MAFDISNSVCAQVNAKAVEAALSFCGLHGQRYGRAMAHDEGMDCIGLIERVSAAVGAPVSIDRDWQDNGGDLPMMQIPMELAEPGDVLVFDLGNTRAFRRFQLGVLISGKTTDREAQFVGVPHAVSTVWLAAPLWAVNLIKVYRFTSPSKAVQGDAISAVCTVMTTEALADFYGASKAILDAAEARCEAIKAEIKARGLEELVGRDFAVTVTEQIQGRPDVKALKDHLGAAYSRFERPSVTNVVRVKAMASARLQNAA
jgi:hypothetical protein